MNKKFFTNGQVLMLIITCMLLIGALSFVIGYEYGAERMAADLNNYIYVRSVIDADNTNIGICYNKATNQMYYYENDKPYVREPIWIFEDNIMRPAYYPEDN